MSINSNGVFVASKIKRKMILLAYRRYEAARSQAAHHVDETSKLELPKRIVMDVSASIIPQLALCPSIKKQNSERLRTIALRRTTLSVNPVKPAFLRLYNTGKRLFSCYGDCTDDRSVDPIDGSEGACRDAVSRVARANSR
jgi:hypothetical protein